MSVRGVSACVHQCGCALYLHVFGVCVRAVCTHTVVCVLKCVIMCTCIPHTAITQLSHSLPTSPSVSAPAQSWSDVGPEDTPLAPVSTSSGQEEHHHI